MTKKERWILSEWMVAKDRVQNHSELLYYHQYETSYAEVDLVFGSSDPTKPITMIEVKTASEVVSRNLWGRSSVLSRRQYDRLLKARWALEIKAQRPVRFLLAVVDPVPSMRIRYFEAPF